MFPTAEVRWFIRGEIPSKVWGWYHRQGTEPEEQPSRVDYYLGLEEGDSLGVKLREGRIEIKRRYGHSEIVYFGERIVGRVEYWNKWGFTISGVDTNLPEWFESPNWWIGVRKERKLRTYQVTTEKTVTEVVFSGSLGSGCGWELAKIRIEGVEEPWWSVGFEAFGKESDLKDTLMLVAESVLKTDISPVLTIANSYGYPKWLMINVASRT